MGGPVSGGVQNLNRSQGIYDLAMCGRESARRWEEGWTHGWRQDVLSGSVPLKYTSGTCGARSQAASLRSIIPSKPAGGSSPGPGAEGPGAALLLAWMLLPVSRGGLLVGTSGCPWEQDQGPRHSPPVCLQRSHVWPGVELGTRTGSDPRGPQFGQGEEPGTREYCSRKLPSFWRMLTCPHLCSIFSGPAKPQSRCLPCLLQGKERFCYS